ncbi:MAG: hypothetical protein H7301_08145 [Cryobacterium sp.]|nr:hypothetical protein [Oligoflexia bacterium]
MIFRRFISFMPFLVMIASFGFNASPALATGGNSSGGGDAYSAEFVHLGLEVANMLARSPKKGVDLRAFRAAVAQTRVFSSPRVFLGSQELDAVNTPSLHRIVMGRIHWDALLSNPRKKLVLVAHEYFSIMGLDDRSYAYSNGLFADPGKPVTAYVCNAFEDFKTFGNFRLEFLVYKDLYSVRITTPRGDAIDQPVGWGVFYNYNLKTDTKDPVGFRGEWILTAQALFATRMISLGDIEKGQSGDFPMIDVQSVSPLKIRRSSAYCKVIHY